MPHIIISKVTHTDEKPLFKCDHGDCEYSTPSPSYLRKHKRTHTKKNKNTDCGLKISQSSELEAHTVAVHKRDPIKKTFECEICGFVYLHYFSYLTHKCKRFKCDYKKCKYKTSQAEDLVLHKKKHPYKKYKCDYKKCEYKTSRPDALVRHKKTHTEKNYKCDYEGCESKFTFASGLEFHKKIHTGYKPFKCDYEGCESKFLRAAHLTNHKRKHTGEKPFKCDYEGCEAKFSQSGTLAKHKKTHTIREQLRMRIQENHLFNKLEKWGFSVDVETTINAQKENCLTDTNRYYSRLDYHVINCTSAILLIECDEDQHTGYELSCELSRMSDVRAALMTAGYELPIYWIRYNPNGKYHIGDEQVKTYRPEREVALKSKLEELCSPDFVPDKQVNIHYMFYDLISEEVGPSIMIESDFPEHLKKCVSWN